MAPRSWLLFAGVVVLTVGFGLAGVYGAPATGYAIGFIRFEDGEPVSLEEFVSGFLIEDGTANFGRLAGVAVARDGALLFTDDTNGMIYRVSYEG